MTPRERAEKIVGKYVESIGGQELVGVPDGSPGGDLVEAITEALEQSAVPDETIAMPSEEQLLESNRKYVEANWMPHDPKGSLDHAYYHGQKDLLEMISAAYSIRHSSAPEPKAVTSSHGLSHPYKETCSGWKAGFDEALKSSESEQQNLEPQALGVSDEAIEGEATDWHADDMRFTADSKVAFAVGARWMRDKLTKG